MFKEKRNIFQNKTVKKITRGSTFSHGQLIVAVDDMKGDTAKAGRLFTDTNKCHLDGIMSVYKKNRNFRRTVIN